MRAIVELDGAPNREVILGAKDKVEMFGSDATKGAVPRASIVRRPHGHDIGDANLAENPIVFTHGLVEHKEQRPLSGREQRAVLDIGKL